MIARATQGRRVSTPLVALLAVGVLLGLATPAVSPAGEVRWSGPADSTVGMLLLHGGGWETQGSEHLDWMTPYAERFAAQGARVLNADPAPHLAGIAEVVDAYDALATAVGGPVCVLGESSGGHLALLLAMERDVACVIARAAPTDLVALEADGGGLVAAKARAAFGDDLAPYSPVARADELAGTPVLLAGVAVDWVVPFVQQERLAGLLDDVQLVRLDPGEGIFPHQSANVDQLAALQIAEHALVTRTTGLPMYTPSSVPMWPKPAPPEPPAPPPPPPPPAPDPPRPPAVDPRPRAPLTRPVLPRRSAAGVARSGLGFRQAVRAAGRLEWRLLLGTRVVARATRTLRRPATVTVRLRATKAGRSALRRARRASRLVVETRLRVGGTVVVRRDRVPLP